MLIGPTDIALTLEALRKRAASNERFRRYAAFQGHRARVDGYASAACSGQWCNAPWF